MRGGGWNDISCIINGGKMETGEWEGCQGYRVQKQKVIIGNKFTGSSQTLSRNHSSRISF
jgi:hypothetical protein